MSTGAVIIEGEVRVPMNITSLRRFRKWAHSPEFPDHGKICFIAGEIDIDMSPENIYSHSRPKRDLSTDLNVFVRKRDVGELFFDGMLLVNEGADLGTEPDLMFCSWESLKSGRVEYRPASKAGKDLVEVAGTPDLVVEIISRSSVRKDTVRLRSAYFDAGIPEYWLIDARGKLVDFQLLKRTGKEYVAVAPDAEGFLRSPTFGCRFRIARKRNPIGGYSYRLRHRD
jgi:Uma2 family endonuclease